MAAVKKTDASSASDQSGAAQDGVGASASADASTAESTGVAGADANAAIASDAPKGTTYKVAPGLSITSKRGLLDAGTELFEKDYVSMPGELERLVSIGAVVKS